jgi:hypothetical protein
MAKPEFALHILTNSFPSFGANNAMDAAIGNDLHVAVGEQKIDQDAIVLFSIPNAKLRENLYASLPGGDPAQEGHQIERMFHRKADLAPVPGFAFGNNAGYGGERGWGKEPLDYYSAAEQMPENSRKIH